MTAPSIVGATATSGADGANTTTTTVTLPTFTDGDSLYILINSDPASQVFGLPYDGAGQTTGFVALYSNIDIPSTSPVGTFALFYLNNAQHPRFYNGLDYSCTCPVTTTERQAWMAWAVHEDGGIGTVAATQSGTGTTGQITSIITSANNSLVIGAIVSDSTNTFGTATDYTKLGEISGTSAGSLAIYYQTVGAATTLAGQNVTLGTSRAWRGLAFEIKELPQVITRPVIKPKINTTLARPFLRI